MSKAPPSVEEARKKLLEKSQEKIKENIKRLESTIDTYVETAEDWNDNNDGIPVLSKKRLDKMGAKIENLRKQLKGGRRTRKRRKKGGQTKKVQFSECLSNEDCDARKVCYHQATGWGEDPSLIGTCVDLPAEFKKNDPSIKVTSGLWQGNVVNNPLRQHPEIGIPHGSDLLDRWYGGKKIGLWGNRIKKSMKRLKRKRRKTRKRKRKKSRKKKKRRKRKKTRR